MGQADFILIFQEGQPHMFLKKAAEIPGLCSFPDRN